MAESVLKKANARLKFLYRKKEFLNQNTRKLLVTSLIQCHFDYASSVWYTGLSQNLKSKLQTTQNRVVRFIFNLEPRSHITTDHIKSLNWLPVQSRVDQFMLCHVFKIINNLAPQYLKQFFLQTKQHSHLTRLSVKGGFGIPKVKSCGSKSFCFNAAKLWNNLPSMVAQIPKYKTFKVAVKNELLNQVK